MARLRYDFGIGFDRDVAFDDVDAPTVATYDADLALEPDLPVEVTYTDKPTAELTADEALWLDLAGSDANSKLTPDGDVTLEVEV